MSASTNPVSPLMGSNHDLWVIPPAAHSAWYAHIDWYLNWQLSKGLAQKAQKPALELLQVLENVGITYTPNADTSSGPLLVAGGGRIGAERCMVVEYKSDFHSWLSRVHTICAELQCRRVKVFLPRGVDLEDANAYWLTLAPLEVQLEFSIDEETA